MNVYMHQASLYCEDCAESMGGIETPILEDYIASDTGHDSDSAIIGPIANGGGEADTPQHCDSCNCHLENELTDHGMAYIMQAFADRDGNGETLAEWFEFYSDRISDWIRDGAQ